MASKPRAEKRKLEVARTKEKQREQWRLEHRLVARRWYQLEDLPSWKGKALALYEKCSAAPNAQQDEEDIDIDVDLVRVPHPVEVVDHLWEQKLNSEGHELPKPSPEWSQSDSAYGLRRGVTQDGAAKRGQLTRLRVRRPRFGNTRNRVVIGRLAKRGRKRTGGPRGAELARQDVAGDAVVTEERPAPEQLPKIEEVTLEVEQMAPPDTKTLLADARSRDEGRMPTLHGPTTLQTPSRNRAGPNPHGWWTNRLAACDKEVSRMRELLIERGEVILTVVVCDGKGDKDQEFDILASQTLHDLRDSLYFVSDWMYDGQTRFHSACFFIDGIFYSDRRHNDAIDYSVDLISWLRETKPPDFLRAHASKSMDVRLADLGRIPFGDKCVYMHQGDIEHHVIFTNARLPNSHDDCPYPEAYPLLTWMRKREKRKCYACVQLYAIYVVLDSSRCPYNPSFWCQTCFRHFFQDEEGNFITPVDYKVFPYLHDER